MNHRVLQLLSLVRSHLVVLMLAMLGLPGLAGAATATITGLSVQSAPTVISAGSTIIIDVTFSEAVTVNAPVSFSLNSSGTTSYDAADSTSTMVAFFYTVGASDHVLLNGNLDVLSTSLIPATSTAGITCVAAPHTPTSPATWSWNGFSLAAQSILIAPVATSIACVGASSTNANAVSFTVTYSVPVQGVSASSFTPVVSGCTASVGVVTPSSGLNQTYTVPVTISSIPSGTGSVGLNLAAGPTDQAGNSLVLSSPATDQSFAIDQVRPVTVSVATSSPSLTNGTGATSLRFQVQFSKPVALTAAAPFGAVAGNGLFYTATSFTIVPTPSASTFSSIYTVTMPALAATGDNGTLGMSVASAGILDAVGNLITAGVPSPNQSYTISQAQPTVTSILTAGSNPTNATAANALQYQVQFSVPVAITTATPFAAAASGGLTYSATGFTIVPTPSASTFSSSYTVTLPALTAPGHNGVLGLTVANAGIADQLGNAIGSGTITPNQSYTINQTQPVVTAITTSSANPTNATGASSLQFQVQFSAPVAITAATPFAAAASGGLTYSATSFTIVPTPSAGTFSTSYAVTLPALTAPGHTGVLGLTVASAGIADQLGNVLGSATIIPDQSYTVTQTQPTVTSIAILNPAPANGQLQFQVTFSTNVSGVSPGNFAPSLAGLSASSSVSTVTTSSASSYVVTLAKLAVTAPSTGTVGLTVSNSPAITDALGNALSLGSIPIDQVYALVPPQISSISCLDANPNPEPGPVRFLVTFSTPVNHLVPANFPFATNAQITAIGTASITPIANSASVIVQIGGIQLAAGVNSVPLSLPFAPGTGATSAQDVLGNNAVSSVPSNSTSYIVTTQVPLITLAGTPAQFIEHAATPTHVFNCTNLTDTGSSNFVSASQHGSLDANVSIPAPQAVAPTTTSSDGGDQLLITPTVGDGYALTNQATSPAGIITGDLLLNSVAVGHYAVTGSNLHIDFQNVITLVQVQQLINDITFANPGKNPSLSSRQAFLSITDGLGRSSPTTTQLINITLYNDTSVIDPTLPSIFAPRPRIIQPGQQLVSHIPTNDIDSYFVCSPHDPTTGVPMSIPAGSFVTFATAKGTVQVTQYGDWTYTANPGVSGQDSFTITLTDIGPGQGTYTGGDALIPPQNITQQILIVPTAYQALSPSFTTNPPLEAELGSAFAYTPSVNPGTTAATGGVAFDLIDLDNQGLSRVFSINAATGALRCATVPTPASGYIHIAILVSVTDTLGVVRGAFQPLLLKVVSSASGGG